MTYLRNLPRVTEEQLRERIAGLAIDPPLTLRRAIGFQPDGRGFVILDHIENPTPDRT